MLKVNKERSISIRSIFIFVVANISLILADRSHSTPSYHVQPTWQTTHSCELYESFFTWYLYPSLNIHSIITYELFATLSLGYLVLFYIVRICILLFIVISQRFISVPRISGLDAQSSAFGRAKDFCWKNIQWDAMYSFVTTNRSVHCGQDIQIRERRSKRI